MPARCMTASGDRTRLLAMSSQSTQAKVSPSQTPKRSGSSMIIVSGQILPIWPYQEWSLSQLERVVCPHEEGSGEALRRSSCGVFTDQQIREVIQRKLVAYKRQNQAKGLRFNLKVDHILELKETQNNHCAA